MRKVEEKGIEIEWKNARPRDRMKEPEWKEPEWKNSTPACAQEIDWKKSTGEKKYKGKYVRAQEIEWKN